VAIWSKLAIDSVVGNLIVRAPCGAFKTSINTSSTRNMKLYLAELQCWDAVNRNWRKLSSGNYCTKETDALQSLVQKLSWIRQRRLRPRNRLPRYTRHNAARKMRITHCNKAQVRQNRPLSYKGVPTGLDADGHQILPYDPYGIFPGAYNIPRA
jgi:hypothetical protein